MVGRPRDGNDRIAWLAERGRFADALDVAEEDWTGEGFEGCDSCDGYLVAVPSARSLAFTHVDSAVPALCCLPPAPRPTPSRPVLLVRAVPRSDTRRAG